MAETNTASDNPARDMITRECRRLADRLLTECIPHYKLIKTVAKRDASIACLAHAMEHSVLVEYKTLYNEEPFCRRYRNTWYIRNAAKRGAAIVASVGMVLTMVMLSACTEVKHPAMPEPKPITAESSMVGCSNIKVTWMWAAEPATVEIEVSRDDTNWVLLCKQQAVAGRNETYVLIPIAYLLNTNSTPRMRIGTAERRRCFAIPNELRGVQ